MVNYLVDKERFEKMKQDHTQQKYTLKTEWEKNKENILAFGTKIDLVKSKIMFVKGILKEYYTNLLKQGTDTR